MAYEVILGYGLDLIFGDPVRLPHPIRWIGRLIKSLEKIVRRGFFNLKIGGFFLASIVILVTYIVTSFIIWLSAQINHF